MEYDDNEETVYTCTCCGKEFLTNTEERIEFEEHLESGCPGYDRRCAHCNGCDVHCDCYEEVDEYRPDAD